jgi:hypothetical protein
VNGEPDAVGVHVQIADVPEIVTAPAVPQLPIALPPAVNVTVPVCPLPTVAVMVICVPSCRGEAGETAIERVDGCFTIVNVADLLAE